MNTIQTCFKSVINHLASTPCGQGVIAIASALKAIHSLGKTKNESSTPREIVATFQRDYQTLTYAEDKQFHFYKARYGKERDEETVRDEFVAILKIIDFFKEDTNMWTDMHYGILRHKLPKEIQTAIDRHFREVKGYTDTPTRELNAQHVQFFEKFIQEEISCTSGVDVSEQKIALPIVSDTFVEDFAQILQDDDIYQQFINYASSYGEQRSQETLMQEFSTIIQAIESLKAGDSSCLEKLPKVIQEKMYQHLPKNSGQQNAALIYGKFLKVLITRINPQAMQRFFLRACQDNENIFQTQNVDAIQKSVNLPLSVIEHFVHYRDNYGKSRDINDVIKEFVWVMNIIAIVKSKPDGFNTSQCQSLICQLPYEVQKAFLQHQIILGTKGKDCLTQEAFLDFFRSETIHN